MKVLKKTPAGLVLGMTYPEYWEMLDFLRDMKDRYKMVSSIKEQFKKWEAIHSFHMRGKSELT